MTAARSKKLTFRPETHKAIRESLAQLLVSREILAGKAPRIDAPLNDFALNYFLMSSRGSTQEETKKGAV